MTPPAPMTGSPTNAADAAVELVERTLEVARVVVRDFRDVTDERPVAVADCRDPRERRAVRVRTVVREPA